MTGGRATDGVVQDGDSLAVAGDDGAIDHFAEPRLGPLNPPVHRWWLGQNSGSTGDRTVRPDKIHGRMPPRHVVDRFVEIRHFYYVASTLFIKYAKDGLIRRASSAENSLSISIIQFARES